MDWNRLAGCNGFLAKPINQRSLKLILKEYLQKENGEGNNGEEPLVDPAIQAKALPLFRKRLVQMREELLQALATKEWSSVKRTTHNIKGSAALFGFTELSGLGKRVCDDIEAGNLGALPAKVEALIDALNQAIDGVKK